jgi:hypothetical protein
MTADERQLDQAWPERLLAELRAGIEALERAKALDRRRSRPWRPPGRRPPGPPPARVAALADALVSGRLTVARAAELLHVPPAAVPAVAAGRLEVGRRAWRRLDRALTAGTRETLGESDTPVARQW